MYVKIWRANKAHLLTPNAVSSCLIFTCLRFIYAIIIIGGVAFSEANHLGSSHCVMLTHRVRYYYTQELNLSSSIALGWDRLSEPFLDYVALIAW